MERREDTEREKRELVGVISSDSIVQAYVKERDTLCTMLAKSEKISAISSSALPQQAAAMLNGAVVTTEQTDLGT